MSTVATQVLPPHVQESVGRFVAWLETGETDGLFAPDVFADISLPHWRVQVRGAEDLVSAKNRTHPPAGHTRIEKVLAAGDGYAVKFEERWEDGQQWYCREAAIIDLDEQGRIAEFHYYCTGDWDEALVAQHAEAVTLLRP